MHPARLVLLALGLALLPSATRCGAQAAHTAAPSQPAKKASPAKAYTWQPYHAPDGRFSLEFPGATTSAERPSSLDKDTPVTVHFVSAKLPEDTSYTLTFLDYPKTDNDPQKLLESARNGTLRDAHAELVTDTPLTVDGFPAREFEGLSNGRAIDGRVILAGGRMFFLMAYTSGAEYSQVKHFFASLKITPQ
jgi:hypothetical protein